MRSADPPEHDTLRQVMNRALSPTVLKTLQTTFKAKAHLLVDELLEQGTFDAMPDLAAA